VPKIDLEMYAKEQSEKKFDKDMENLQKELVHLDEGKYFFFPDAAFATVRPPEQS
jgi:hypothetical protein